MDNNNPYRMFYQAGQSEAFVVYLKQRLQPAERETLKTWLAWLQKSQCSQEMVTLIPGTTAEMDLHVSLSKAWKDFLKIWDRRN